MIACIAIALGMAEGDLLFTNPEISKDEAMQAIIKTLDATRDVAIEVLHETQHERLS